VPINLVLGGAAFIAYGRFRSSRLYISHWLSTNANWRIIGAWREPLQLTLHCAIPRSSGFGWG
jgi:hypothetical protein